MDEESEFSVTSPVKSGTKGLTYNSIVKSPSHTSMDVSHLTKSSYDKPPWRHCIGMLKSWRKYVSLVLIPLIFSPLPIAVSGKEARTGYIIIIMASYWILEVFPMATTALFPLVLFPMFGILTAKEVSLVYFEDNNMIFFGGLMMAVAVQRWNLHKRFALRTLLICGTRPERLLFGFMLITAFVSMFVSDTATTAMIMPIGEAVLLELEREESLPNLDVNESELGMSQKEDKSKEEEMEESLCTTERESLVEEKGEKLPQSFQKGLMLSIAYSALIGGTATLTGTGPNLIMSGQIERLLKKGPNITYLSWAVYAFPQMLILLSIAWFYMVTCVLKVSIRSLCCGCFTPYQSTRNDRKAYQVIVREYKKLGKMKFAEKVVLCHFVILVFLWIFRDPKVFPGWASAFRKGFVSDGTTAIFVVLSLFAFPSEKPRLFCWNKGGEVTSPPEAVLTWDTVKQKLPWGIILLLGSGYAIAEACEKSGLSIWIGSQLNILAPLPPYAIVALSCIMVTAFTEISSNVATATIFLPILASVAVSVHIHPWYLMLPATVACSFAFMLPISTPPNAIVFSTGRLRVKDMVTCGAGLDLIGLLVLNLCINTYGAAYFGLHEFPTWAKRVHVNSTTKLP